MLTWRRKLQSVNITYRDGYNMQPNSSHVISVVRHHKDSDFSQEFLKMIVKSPTLRFWFRFWPLMWLTACFKGLSFSDRFVSCQITLGVWGQCGCPWGPEQSWRKNIHYQGKCFMTCWTLTCASLWCGKCHSYLQHRQEGGPREL